MSEPRQLLSGTFYEVTRRCAQQQFILRPDPETNNAVLYCLIVAAQRYRIEIILPSVMSNHHHTTVLDREQMVSAFMEYFHGMLARCQNAVRGRHENCWSSDAPSLVELGDRAAVIDAVVYGATNPVKDQLVDRVHHWPGVNGLSALLNQRTITARRPNYFRDDGTMPATVSMELTIPEELGDPEVFRQTVRERVERVEEEHAEHRRRSGRQVLGRRRILRQSWRDYPASAARRQIRVRGDINPRFKTRDLERRRELMLRRQVFLRDYRLARIALLAGTPIPFPTGTYWLRRFAGVPIVVAVSN